jgi:exopolyphosphatase/guanosine-5'-triphosphate,3'-diphosphate pyrophosphatase
LIIGIVDIGSNTVRLNVYSIKKNKICLMFSKKVQAGLINYKKKKILTEDGIKILTDTIKDFLKILKFLNISNYHFFATASLRNIKNKEVVLKQVKDKVGVQIEIISGEEEAELSFNGAISNINTKNGILIDVGGGSTEIVIFKNNTPIYKTSLPIGSLSLFNTYVDHMLPTAEEAKSIREEVINQLNKDPIKQETMSNMVCIGGTIRAINKLLIMEKLHDESKDIIPSVLLKKLEIQLENNNKETYMKILKVKASRIHTLVPGLIIIDTICDYFNVQNVQVSPYGVREGYVHTKILKEENHGKK